MKPESCPYCQEEIKARARVCKHCRSRIRWTREEMMLAVLGEIFLDTPAIIIPSGDPCEALCYSKFSDPEYKAPLNECLDDCKAVKAMQMVAEKLNIELYESFLEIVWAGGDIDPVPLEKEIRERFSRMR